MDDQNHRHSAMLREPIGREARPDHEAARAGFAGRDAEPERIIAERLLGAKNRRRGDYRPPEAAMPLRTARLPTRIIVSGPVAVERPVRDLTGAQDDTTCLIHISAIIGFRNVADGAKTAPECESGRCEWICYSVSISVGEHESLVSSVVIAWALGFAAPIGAATPLDPAMREFPRPSVVMLWGSWCVSCRAELQRLPQLERSAAPLPMVTLALDPPAVARGALSAAGLPVRNAFADARPPATVLAAWGGEGAALPLAVAIDGRGRICGSKRGLLGTSQLREWAKRCSR